VALPMSGQCARTQAKPSSVPSWKAGVTTLTSGRWLPPKYGSLWMNTSPGSKVPKAWITAFTASGIEPR
jgi:hypothetical protein